MPTVQAVFDGFSIYTRFMSNYDQLPVLKAAHKLAVSEAYLRPCQTLMLEQTQPSRGVLKKSCSENMQQIYRRTPMAKCDFNKVAVQPY